MAFALLGFLGGKDRDPAECVIEVDDQEISSLYPFLVEATVQTARLEASTATLQFETRRDETGEWLVQDAFGLDPTQPLLGEWKRIKISAAFGAREEEVFRGFIRQVKAEYPQDAGAAKVTVECQDDSIALDRTHTQRVWGTQATPASDALVVPQVLDPYSWLVQQDTSDGFGQGQSSITNLNQDSTDIVFLKARAEANGYELIFRRGTVYFGPMRLQGQMQSTIMVYAGTETNCLSLSVATDAHQPDQVIYTIAPQQGSTAQPQDPVDPSNPALGPNRLTSTNSGLAPYVQRLQPQVGADDEAPQALALKVANEADIHKVQGEGELDGALYGHVLLSGQPVPVDGLGSRFSGTYYVDTVSHTFNSTGYRQRFKLLRNATGDNLDSVPNVGSVLSALY